MDQLLNDMKRRLDREVRRYSNMMLHVRNLLIVL